MWSNNSINFGISFFMWDILSNMISSLWLEYFSVFWLLCFLKFQVCDFKCPPFWCLLCWFQMWRAYEIAFYLFCFVAFTHWVNISVFSILLVSIIYHMCTRDLLCGWHSHSDCAHCVGDRASTWIPPVEPVVWSCTLPRLTNQGVIMWTKPEWVFVIIRPSGCSRIPVPTIYSASHLGSYGDIRNLIGQAWFIQEIGYLSTPLPAHMWFSVWKRDSPSISPVP